MIISRTSYLSSSPKTYSPTQRIKSQQHKMGQLSTYQIVALIVCITAYIINASPLPQPADNQELDVLHIPLTNGKEIDVLTLGSKDQEQLIADRNKRTIGLLRELFPDITKEIDSIVNRIIAQVIRVAGPGLLNSILSENRGGAGGGSTTQSSSFDADFDDDSFDDDNDDVAAGCWLSNTNSSFRCII
ncbi:hypothetical protein ACLKA6_016233 [Drosophila palustris]